VSQLSKAVVATTTGERRYVPQKISPLFQDIFSSTAEIQEVAPEIGTMYRVECKIGSRVIISDRERVEDVGALEKAIIRTKHQIIEGVFGEFRPYFRRIEQAIYNYDYAEASRLLHEMERLMFEPE
jgi:hypothetical protein